MEGKSCGFINTFFNSAEIEFVYQAKTTEAAKLIETLQQKVPHEYLVTYPGFGSFLH
jgi:hypothetical protein